MSIEPAHDDELIEDDHGPKAKRMPLLPEAGAAGAPLTAVIAVICFLAALALTGFFSVSKAARDWTADLRGSITIQVKGSDVGEIAANTETVMEFLQGTEGILSAESLSREEAASCWSHGSARAICRPACRCQASSPWRSHPPCAANSTISQEASPPSPRTPLSMTTAHGMPASPLRPG